MLQLLYAAWLDKIQQRRKTSSDETRQNLNKVRDKRGT
jgi:hypothetical protein